MDKSLGRGQRLKSVIKDYCEKKPENPLNQLHKISTDEYSNESIEKFCDELASENFKSYASSRRKEGMHRTPHEIQNSESEVMKKYREDFPSLENCRRAKSKRDIQYKANDTKDHLHDIPAQTSYFSIEGTVQSQSSAQLQEKPITIAKGIGRGQRLKLVTKSIPLTKSTWASEIERACGSDYTNQSIERFVKELTEKQESMNNSEN